MSTPRSIPNGWVQCLYCGGYSASVQCPRCPPVSIPLPENVIAKPLDHDNNGDVSKTSAIPPTSELWSSYLELGSVHKVGKKHGTTGETVRKYLKIGGHRLNRTKWTAEEDNRIRQAYASPEPLDLLVLSKDLGRTEVAISLHASELGITASRGTRKRSERHRANMSDAQKARWNECTEAERNWLRDRTEGMKPFLGKTHSQENKDKVSAQFKKWHSENKHPRGMLGKKHTKETCEIISSKNKGRKRPPEEVTGMLKTKFAKYGTTAPNVRHGSWKSGWREIGGRRIYARSRWEANYARYLQFLKENGQISEWEHEPHTFWFEKIKRGARSYLPDFRVTFTTGAIEFHETKGWMDARSKTKIRRMAKYHPSVKLVVLGAEWFKANRIKLRAILPGWEDGKLS